MVNGAFEGTTSALVDTAINGGSLSDNLETALLNSSVNAAHGFAAGEIANYKDSYLLHKILHAAAGCAAAAAKQAECEAGAIGASVGEIVAEMLPDPENSSSYEEYRKARERQLLLAQFIAGTISAYSGYDAQTAIDIANTAVTNNRQLRTREIERIKQLAANNPNASEADYIVASCALIKCSAHLPEGSVEYQIAKKLELEGAKAKYSALRTELSKQVYKKTTQIMSPIREGSDYKTTIVENLFEATPKTDALNRLNAKYQVGTRAEGIFITVAGGVTAGVSAAGFSTCATGVGCALAVAGTAYGSDVMSQGLLQTYTGKSQNSLGALALHEIFGIPKDTAEAVYSLAGIAGEVNAIRTGLKNAASTGKVTLPQPPAASELQIRNILDNNYLKRLNGDPSVVRPLIEAPSSVNAGNLRTVIKPQWLSNGNNVDNISIAVAEIRTVSGSVEYVISGSGKSLYGNAPEFISYNNKRYKVIKVDEKQLPAFSYDVYGNLYNINHAEKKIYEYINKTYKDTPINVKLGVQNTSVSNIGMCQGCDKTTKSLYTPLPKMKLVVYEGSTRANP